MRTYFIFGLALAAAAPVAYGQAPAEPAVIPRPVSISAQSGAFILTAHTTIAADRADSAVATRFARALEPATGLAIHVVVRRTAAGNRIVFRRVSPRDRSLGAEGYRLVVRRGVLMIESQAPAGAFYATQTVLQLLPADIFRAAPLAGVTWTIPAVTIVDRPRFAWRGMHLDVARHFMPKELVKKYIDLLALYKMNSFHWHLTDDQGWRI
ncbi:MAG TPA: glycoside hydrolase family 20 zincin-like fold domain-containing protein, partial [Gemmatimonadaceae bacterium]|nr:glycoside hydrolase family 20 zincin-like fold domain-containing protein [Gemmatimonadaceae bacterium]